MNFEQLIAYHESQVERHTSILEENINNGGVVSNMLVSASTKAKEFHNDVVSFLTPLLTRPTDFSECPDCGGAVINTNYILQNPSYKKYSSCPCGWKEET